MTTMPTNTTTTVTDRYFEEALPKRPLRPGSRTSHLAQLDGKGAREIIAGIPH